MIKNSYFIYRILIVFFVFGIFISYLTFNSLEKIYAEDNKIILSEMTEDEALEYVVNAGVEIPLNFTDEVILKKFIKNAIEKVENNPNYNFLYNYWGSLKLANDIKKIVNEYYQIDFNKNISYMMDYNYYMTDSKVYNNGQWCNYGGDWNDRYLSYNCYAFAINRYEMYPYYETRKAYQPGDFSNVGEYYYGIPIEDLADIVVADLNTLGYTNISIYDSIPFINNNQRMLCVRTGDTDFHFMKYDLNTNAWYHKPNDTAILKYNYIPTNDRYWINENSYYGVTYEGNIIYDSQIKYIVYDYQVVNLNCRSIEKKSQNIEKNTDYIYEINVECARQYAITVSSSSSIVFDLYDENMNYVETNPTFFDNGTKWTTLINLNVGKYYLRVCFSNFKSEGTIETTLESTWISYYEVYQGNNNILNYNHFHPSNQNASQLYYINNTGAGFYEFKLNVTKADGSDFNYSEGSIVVKNHINEIIENKYSVFEYDDLAVNKENINNMYLYLNRNGYFYIHINIPNIEYLEISFTITKVENQNIEVFNRIDQEFTEEIFVNIQTEEYAKELRIDAISKFRLEVNADSNLNEDLIIILFKKEYDSSKREYFKIDKVADIICSGENSREYILDLDVGVYYIGFFNNLNKASINVMFNRILLNNTDRLTAMVTDPNSSTLHGSEVTLNKGVYRGNTITEGFTRYIYLFGENVPSTSRTDYYWYSSNQNIASVSSYGTVLAKNISTDTAITIIAIYKDNPSIIYKKEFIIKKEVSNTPIIINLTMNVKLGDITSINLGNSAPYNFLQYYSWSTSDSSIATVSYFGKVSGISLGETIITGSNYIYNDRITINIIVKVTN